MNRGLSLITALLVLISVVCVGGTVMSKERDDYTRENERYALLEDAFKERARGITWTRDRDGARSYRVEIHHRGIESLDDDGKEKLTEALHCEEFCGEVEELRIIFS